MNRRPIHPEAVPGEPLAVRWVVDTGDLPTGEVTVAPGTLGPLMQYGVITRLLVEKGGVWTWLAEGLTWTDHGPRIRDAINASLDLEGWQVTESADLLRLVTADVVGNQLAGYIGSHGGHITVEEATADVVTLDFGGACEDCPAAGETLHERVRGAVAARYPGLKEVRRKPGQEKPRGWLGLPVPGRGRQ